MLIYAQRPAQRTPHNVAGSLGWYAVGVPPDDAHPIRVALTEATLLAGGGNVIYPGTTLDLYGEGVWIDAPDFGGVPFVWVERRNAPTPVYVDPLGQLRSISGAKAFIHTLVPRVWKVLASNISGMLGMTAIPLDGAKVWVGSHLDTTKTPYEPNATSGVSWVLPAEGQHFPGNPELLAWTEEPAARVLTIKYLRGRQ
jgi:hypothetical protein